MDDSPIDIRALLEEALSCLACNRTVQEHTIYPQAAPCINAQVRLKAGQSVNISAPVPVAVQLAEIANGTLLDPDDPLVEDALSELCNLVAGPSFGHLGLIEDSGEHMGIPSVERLASSLPEEGNVQCFETPLGPLRVCVSGV